MTRNTIQAGIAGLATVAVAGPAFAHHPMGGATPETIGDGLLSGIGHPIIGIDHLAFILAVGLAAAFTPRRFLMPLAFVVATIAGCLIAYAGGVLPLAELVISGSVLLAGALILSGRPVPAAAYLALFSVAGLFHGFAYGEAIIGGETTPLVAYLIGFGVTQFAIASAVAVGVRAVWNAVDASAIQPRLAGALAAGIGFAFFVETVEGMIF